jgi:hypothetical protein
MTTQKITIYKPLIGKVFTSVELIGKFSEVGQEIQFKDQDGLFAKFYHQQDCCESVGVEDINGDLSDLVGQPILMAESVSKEEDGLGEHHTWTFYKFATVKGFVDVRWHGSSNGYYSEAVEFWVKELSK